MHNCIKTYNEKKRFSAGTLPSNYWTMQSVVPVSNWWCVWVWHCSSLIRGSPMYIRSGVIWCTLLMVLYLDHTWQCGLHMVLWSHIGTLMHRLAAEPRKYSRTFIPLSVSLWDYLANPAFDGVGLTGFKSRANAFFFGLSCSIPTIVFYCFSLYFLSVCRFDW